MCKKFKIFILVLSIVIFIITIHSLTTFIFIPNMQKEKVIKSFTEESDKFENVHNYIVKTNPFLQCRKNQDGKVEIYFYKYSKTTGEPEKEETQIEDKLVLENINYILYNLDFEYIQNIECHTYFVFRDEKGHLQSIDYRTDDITKFKHWNWNYIKLNGNWYYCSIWKYFNKNEDVPELIYLISIVFHIIRGY
ncbi:MAG: hypothetical protein ABRQ27_14435 [Clostridiaceae bacterium]